MADTRPLSHEVFRTLEVLIEMEDAGRPTHPLDVAPVRFRSDTESAVERAEKHLNELRDRGLVIRIREGSFIALLTGRDLVHPVSPEAASDV